MIVALGFSNISTMIPNMMSAGDPARSAGSSWPCCRRMATGSKALERSKIARPMSLGSQGSHWHSPSRQCEKSGDAPVDFWEKSTTLDKSQTGDVPAY